MPGDALAFGAVRIAGHCKASASPRNMYVAVFTEPGRWPVVHLSVQHVLESNFVAGMLGDCNMLYGWATGPSHTSASDTVPSCASFTLATKSFQLCHETLQQSFRSCDCTPEAMAKPSAAL